MGRAWLNPIIEWRGPTPRGFKRHWNGIRKRAWRNLGLEWRSKFLPKHFTVAGGQRYGYTPRQSDSKRRRRAYSRRKMRIKGHARPLVWSGKSRDRSRSSKITATSRKGATVKINAPTLNFRVGKRSLVRMGDEVTRVVSKELTALSRGFERHVIKEMKKIDEAKTVRLGF